MNANCVTTSLVSVTSAGQITPVAVPPYFVVIDRALRDEGTSYHYAAPSEFADADQELADCAVRTIEALDLPVHRGASWTTDAPFRSSGVLGLVAGSVGVAPVLLTRTAHQFPPHSRPGAVVRSIIQFGRCLSIGGR